VQQRRVADDSWIKEDMRKAQRMIQRKRAVGVVFPLAFYLRYVYLVAEVSATRLDGETYSTGNNDIWMMKRRS